MLDYARIKLEAIRSDTINGKTTSKMEQKHQTILDKRKELNEPRMATYGEKQRRMERYCGALL